VNYSRIIGRAARLMKNPSVIDSPSGRLPAEASRWDLSGTETCGGGKSISWTPLRVLIFLGIYSPGIRSNGAWWGPRGTRARLAPPGAPWWLVGPTKVFWPPPEASSILHAQEKISKKFHCIWTSFDIDFL
jgi:hypothetical protein